MRLAIVGSTSFPSEACEDAARAIIRGFLASYRPVAVISGGASGVDTWVEEEAEFFLNDLDLPGEVLIHAPAYRRWEPDGFKARNELIAQDCTHLLAIRSLQSKSYGSGWTADRAEALGKTVWRVFL